MTSRGKIILDLALKASGIIKNNTEKPLQSMIHPQRAETRNDTYFKGKKV